MVAAKAKAATANDELVSLKQQVSDLVWLRLTKYEDNLEGQILNRIAPTIETKQTKDPRYLGVLVNNLVLPDHPKIIKYHANAITVGDGST